MNRTTGQQPRQPQGTPIGGEFAPEHDGGPAASLEVDGLAFAQDVDWGTGLEPEIDDAEHPGFTPRIVGFDNQSIPARANDNEETRNLWNHAVARAKELKSYEAVDLAHKDALADVRFWDNAGIQHNLQFFDEGYDRAGGKRTITTGRERAGFYAIALAQRKNEIMAENFQPPCVCAHHKDGSVTTSICPQHADSDPCADMAFVTGTRRKGSIKNGVCSNCGWDAHRVAGEALPDSAPPKQSVRPGDSSPWGKIQNVEVIADGIELVDTASHGGTIKPSPSNHGHGIHQCRCKNEAGVMFSVPGQSQDYKDGKIWYQRYASQDAFENWRDAPTDEQIDTALRRIVPPLNG